MKIFITAPPETGKSTVIAGVIERLRCPKRGILAREIRDESGQRVGFTSLNEAGDTKDFMSRTNSPTAESICEFDVDVSAIDDFVVPELRDGLLLADTFLYIDEVGRAQAKSSSFLDVLRQIANSPCSFLGSIVYDDEPWSREFKNHPEVCVLEVTARNRNALPEILLAAFSTRADFARLSPAQQSLCYMWLCDFVREAQFDSARKLFTNAIGYVLGEKVTECVPGQKYEVKGKTSKHSITCDTRGSFGCDCDLSNGRGLFQNNPGPCSHVMAIKLHRLTD
ncbi:MAG: nucleoside-triphosphatase [Candidatus Obscuribacterales bacterium]|nr:nucleoside-triphosphatase [Candidatus Obscuribacterales bacterium]